jgi:hypothetical protein
MNSRQAKILNRQAKKLWKKDKGRCYVSYRAVYAMEKIKLLRGWR